MVGEQYQGLLNKRKRTESFQQLLREDGKILTSNKGEEMSYSTLILALSPPKIECVSSDNCGYYSYCIQKELAGDLTLCYFVRHPGKWVIFQTEEEQVLFLPAKGKKRGDLGNLRSIGLTSVLGKIPQWVIMKLI